jgi:glycogen debranching enzyme
MEPPLVAEHDHGHLSWIDACFQQILSARLLVSLNGVAGSPHTDEDLRAEAAALARLVNRRMWDEQAGFYVDRLRDGRLSSVKSVGAYWGLLAAAVPPARRERFIAHLEDPASFNRPHRVPSLSADHPLYRPGGDYWRGSVWPPTNYMVLQGLRVAGRDDLAHAIALNHLANVLAVFEATGTLWENYAPESAAPGQQAAKDFVGWAGLPPIAVLLEYVFGLQPDALRGRVVWDIRLIDGHGVRRYPFGRDGTIDLWCGRRGSEDDAPAIEAASDTPVTLEVKWKAGSRTLRIGGRPRKAQPRSA